MQGGVLVPYKKQDLLKKLKHIYIAMHGITGGGKGLIEINYLDPLIITV